MDYTKLNKDNVLVFDFDGTMCRLFKNYDLGKVVQVLQKTMKEYNIDFSEKMDAFDVFSEVISQTEDNENLREELLLRADEIITNAELEAVLTGELVKGVDRVFPDFVDLGIKIGVSTNNSPQCCKHFMKMHFPHIDIPIFGRVAGNPELMKPNTWSIVEVLKSLNSSAENTIFIGDTPRDYFSAKEAGCRFIGVAPTEKKRQRLLQVVSDNEIVSDFNQLITILEEI